jgi:hypothetical protein
MAFEEITMGTNMLTRWAGRALFPLLLTTTATAQLSGAYTVDPGGTGPRNFPTFAAAAAALLSGISGPCLFTVASTTFPEPVSLPAVKGASATATVVFRAQGTPATIDAGGASSAFVLQMDAKYYTLENLVIKNFTQYGLHLDSRYLSRIWHPVTRCTFNNVQVEGPTNNNSCYTTYFYYCYDCTFTGCRFAGGYYVLYSQGMYNMVFDVCEFDGKGFANRVLAPFNSNDADCLFRNCFIHNPDANGYAMFLDMGHYGTMFWHNVFLTKTYREAVRLAACCAWSRANSFRNNIVVNLGTGPAMVYGWQSSPSALGLDYNDIDFNCYYAPNTTVGAIQLQNNTNGYQYAGSLQGWKTYLKNNANMIIPGGGTAYDQNSIEGHPGLTSLTVPYDLHLHGSSPCINAGTTNLIAGPWISYPPAGSSLPGTVPLDFEGDVRPATGVDIGADEVTVHLGASGAGSPGTTLTFTLSSLTDAGRAYQMGSSSGAGPILIGAGRKLGLSVDNLLMISVGGVFPAIFQNYCGYLDASGKATAWLAIPNIQQLKGVRIHTAFVTLLASAPKGVANVSNTYLFTIL